jgi:hypothetical protein
MKSSVRGDPGGGDVSAVVQQCRKENNAKYTPEEASTMEAELENGGRTLNLPFCFTEVGLRGCKITW